MHRIATFLIAALAVGFIADSASAQIGRGRLLKKLRDDLFGSPIDQAQQQQAAIAAQQKLEAERKAQLEQQKRAAAARQPTPIGTGRKPTATPTPTRQQQVQRNPQTQQRPTQQRRPTPPKQVAKTNQKPKQGFGFQLVEKDEKLIVANVAPTGNAASKGIRRGDVIVGIGGVEVDNTDAFDEIADILSNGDSIEIVYVRGGKSEEIQVSFGEEPNPPEDVASDIQGSLKPVVTNRPAHRPNHGSAQQNFSNQSSSRNRQVSSNGFAPSRPHNETERLNSVVRQQSQQIQALQNELRAIRQQTNPANSGPTRGPAIPGRSVLDPGFN